MSNCVYKRTSIIGRGKFGIVYKGYHKNTKHNVAIKVLDLDTEEDEIMDVQHEIQLLSELKNVPNVTRYYGLFLNDTKLWIIMDYCAGGSVRTLIKPGVFEEKYIGVLLREVLYGLLAVHKLGVIHRDIKAANILISKEGQVQLCDFGVAAKTSNALKRTTMAGTPFWMAPEVIREGDMYDSKADIWSLGITIYEIASGNPPYCDKDAMWAMLMISKSQPPRLEGREYSSVLKEAIALCLDESPHERLLADELLKCRLVRLYKNTPRLVLREMISRYLIWRDRHQRELVYDDARLIVLELPADELQVKWDFDLLLSREYIIEAEPEDEQAQADESDAFGLYTAYQQHHEDTYKLMPTIGATHSGPGLFAYSQNTTLKMPATDELAVPKSLAKLFEEDKDDLLFEPPSFVQERTELPIIEIPDMENMLMPAEKGEKFPLSKPPALLHTQSASASLESRFSNPITGATTPTATAPARARKKTISNSLGLGQTIQSHTPPYVGPQLKTPSPKPPATMAATMALALANALPLKMKPLIVGSNPLLQPINFKNETSQPLLGTTTPTLATAAAPKSKRKPGFQIQMPTPTAPNPLAQLTEPQDDENVNQFGINPAQAAAIPMTMTPVAELREDAVLRGALALGAPPQAPLPQPPSLPGVAPPRKRLMTTIEQSLAPSLVQPVIPRQNSVLGVTSPVSQAQLVTSTTVRFPLVPSVAPELFVDSNNLKQTLVSELETMISLFNQGLEALEDQLA